MENVVDLEPWRQLLLESNIVDLLDNTKRPKLLVIQFSTRACGGNVMAQ